MTTASLAMTTISQKPSWIKELAAYMKPNRAKAIGQLLNTLLPYGALWAVMIYLVTNNFPYWMTLIAAVLSGLFMVRIFILFHDCGHGSFFKSKRANTLLGYLTGILTFAPYEEWRNNHHRHHATSGDLNRRGIGDVWTMTVNEYRKASRWKRLQYRLFRNPLVMFGLGPFFLFLVSMRLPAKHSTRGGWRSIILTNLGVLALMVGLSYAIGFTNYLKIQLPVLYVAGLLGIWLFYVQHQFEDAYWVPSEDWTLLDSALRGSSYYRLPRIMQWFTGNIGLHHIHHLRPGIPNYNLPQCQKDFPAFQEVTPLTFRKSLRSLGLHLWDEEEKKMVGFGSLK